MGEEKWDQVKGKAKEKTGEATGDEDLQAEGQVDQAKGKGKEAWEKGKEAADDLTR